MGATILYHFNDFLLLTTKQDKEYILRILSTKELEDNTSKWISNLLITLKFTISIRSQLKTVDFQQNALFQAVVSKRMHSLHLSVSALKIYV